MEIARKSFDIIKALSRAEMVFFILPALIVLLVIGTVAQAEMGLYAAHQKYFSSIVIWFGPVPLPGGYTLLGVLSLNLLLKFLFYSEWVWRKSGIILSHLGALVLLIGGLVTAISAQERYMPIIEGGASRYLYDYVERALQIYEDDQLRYTIPFADLNSRAKGDLPYGILVTEACANCEILRREDVVPNTAEDIDKNYTGFAEFMALSGRPKGKEPEADLAGITFTHAGLTYIAFEGMPKPVEIDNLKIVLGKAQEALPFEIALTDFQRDVYPGTQQPRGFSSDIIIRDQGIEWPLRISMNEPLRYKGWTFFQSGFEESTDGAVTILAVVKNEGWLFPYIGTGILGFGLLLHCLLMMRRNQI